MLYILLGGKRRGLLAYGSLLIPIKIKYSIFVSNMICNGYVMYGASLFRLSYNVCTYSYVPSHMSDIVPGPVTSMVYVGRIMMIHEMILWMNILGLYRFLVKFDDESWQ